VVSTDKKHSPTPWRVEAYTDIDEVWKIVDANGETVLDCTWVPYEGGGSPPSEENLEFLLERVNNEY
jgi:hypothetical protein